MVYIVLIIIGVLVAVILIGKYDINFRNGNLDGLDSLWLHQNDLTGTMPGEVCALRGPTGITVLDADCGPTNGVGPALIECQLECCTACCDTITGFCFRDTA